jgi:GcrA cell cycle regulator
VSAAVTGPWTADELLQAREMRMQDGASVRDVAKALGRTFDSTRTALRKHGFCGLDADTQRKVEAKSRGPWPTRDDELRKLWNAGHVTLEIARIMRITKNAVVGRAARLMLPSRHSPIRAAPASPVPRHSLPRRHRKSTLAVVQAPVSSVALVPVVAPVPAPQVTTAIVARHSRPERRLLPMGGGGSRVRTCQWIEGEARNPVQFCGEPTVGGGSWCASCRARVFRLSQVLAFERPHD